MSSPLHDVALERAYLAELLCSGNPAITRRHLGSPDRLSPLDCATVQHGKILAAVHELAGGGEELSPLTACAFFERTGAANYVDAVTQLAQSYDPRADSLGVMAERLALLASARRFRVHLQLALESCEKMQLDGAQEHVREGLDESPRARAQVVTVHDSAVAAVVAARKAESGIGRVVSTGFGLLDGAVRGLPPSTMTILGGRAGTGKSSLMLAMALKQARAGVRAGIVSVEDSKELWGARAIAHLSGVSSDELLGRQLGFDSEREIDRALQELQGIGVHLVYALNRPLQDVCTAIRALVSAGCGIVYVDYLQAVFVGTDAKRSELMSAAAQRIKSECQALDVALVLGSQLTRPSEQRRFTEPFESELKESGDLENKSEVIVLLWKTSDEEDAVALGKVCKIKWSKKRPRFELVRNTTGVVTNVIAYHPPSNGHDQRRPRFD